MATRNGPVRRRAESAPLLTAVSATITLVLATTLQTAAAAGHPVVTTQFGDVKGSTNFAKTIDTFHSIPFAKPPTAENDLRFKAPVDPESWTGTLDATSILSGNICPQFDLVGGTGLYLGDEDCLYLSVYRPTDIDPEEPLPVLFWIFGGAYIVGDGYEFGMYNGESLAKEHNVIIVSPNYRVGAFGFLAHEALRAQDPDGSTGNMGIQDQRKALEWVQANIASFGGDPSRVTIFGESAGGFSVCHHFANGARPGLFSAAVMESGSCDTPEFFLGADDAMAFGEKYSEIVGCDGTGGADAYLDCMRGLKTKDAMVGMLAALTKYRNLTVDDITDANKNINETYSVPMELLDALPALAPIMPFGPAIDGSDAGLARRPLDSIRENLHNDVPIIIGTNNDEGTIFVPAAPMVVPGVHLPLDEADVEKTLHHFFDALPDLPNKDIAPVLAQYPSDDYKSEDARCAIMIRDYIFLYPARRAARAVASHAGQSPAYLYHFEYPGNWADMKIMGDYHGSEIAFLWDFGTEILHHFWSDDRKMSDSMGLFWTNLAHFGTPNGPPEGYTDDWCSWDGSFGLDSFCAPADICSYQPKFGDLSFSQSCRVKDEYVVWPEYDADADQNMRLVVPVEVDAKLNHDTCDFWDDYLGF